MEYLLCIKTNNILIQPLSIEIFQDTNTLIDKLIYDFQSKTLYLTPLPHILRKMRIVAHMWSQSSAFGHNNFACCFGNVPCT